MQQQSVSIIGKKRRNLYSSLSKQSEKKASWDSMKIVMPVVGLNPSGSNLHALPLAILKHSWAKAQAIDAQQLQIYILHIQHY